MSTASASRQPDPVYFRELLRIWFLHYLLQHPSVDEIAERLQPAWERALEVSYDPDALRQAHFTVLPRREHALTAYTAAVEAAVLNELHCSEGGVPAPWVCHALHRVISQHERVSFPYPPDATPHYLGELRLSVMAAGGAGVASFVDGEIVGGRENIEKVGILHIDPPSNVDEAELLPPGLDAFNHWDALKDAARRHVDQLIDAMRGRVEEHTQEWPRYYRKGHETLIRKTLPRAVTYLLDQEPFFGGDRTAIYPALRHLGLDSPRDVKKFALKSGKHSYTRGRKPR